MNPKIAEPEFASRLLEGPVPSGPIFSSRDATAVVPPFRKLGSLASVILCLGFLLPAARAQQTASLLALDKSVSVKVSGDDSQGGKVEQTEGGGIRITYSNEKENRPSLRITKTFDPPREVSAVGFEIEGERDLARNGAVHVHNTENRVGLKWIRPVDGGNVEMDLGRTKFVDTKEPFSGKIGKIVITIWLEGGAGEHAIEIKNLHLQ
ncbi:MAG: hypothetical protein WC003_03050 [Terrimicrobiaceae bacterium]